MEVDRYIERERDLAASAKVSEKKKKRYREGLPCSCVAHATALPPK